MNLDENSLKEYMTFKQKGNKKEPLKVFTINDKFIVGVYKGL